MIRVLSITLVTLLLAAPGALRARDEVQAPRSDAKIQAPVSQDEIQGRWVEPA